MRPAVERAALAAGTAVLAMTVTACSGREEPGVPGAAGPGSAASTAGATVSTTRAAARPAVLPLDGVMPCELVTGEMRQRFAIDRPEAPYATEPNAPGCTFISTTAGTYVVAVVRDKGVEALGRPAAASVGGFPAVEISKPEIPGVCHLSVDVADGQRLDVEVQRLGAAVPAEQICGDTRTFAEAVLATLRQKLGR